MSFKSEVRLGKAAEPDSGQSRPRMADAWFFTSFL